VVDAAKSAVGAASDAVTGSGDKDEGVATGAAGGGEGGSSIVGAVVEAGRSAVDSATAAASAAATKVEETATAAVDSSEEAGGGSHHGGISGAVGAVMSGLKDVLLGPDVPVEAVTSAVGEGVGESAEGGGLSQEMQRSADEEGKPTSFAVL
jgi:hypothetical protein